MRRISPNFTLAELEASDTAARLGIDNRVPEALIGNVQRLAVQILQPLRTHTGERVRISSGYRSPKLNAAVGGSTRSQHMQALAADFNVDEHSPLEVCDLIEQLGLPFDQLIHEFGRWVHCSVAPAGQEPRRMLLTIDKHGTRPGLLPVRP